MCRHTILQQDVKLESGEKKTYHETVQRGEIAFSICGNEFREMGSKKGDHKINYKNLLDNKGQLFQMVFILIDCLNLVKLTTNLKWLSNSRRCIKRTSLK